MGTDAVTRGRVDMLLPAATRASGGHRTAVAAAESLAAEGFQVHLHFQRPNNIPGRDAAHRANAAAWHGVRQCRIHIGWPRELPASAAVIATGWRSAAAVAALPTPAVRMHFTQDYESWFFPVGDEHLAARGVHDLGLATIVIGHWLQHQLLAEHGMRTWSIPFTADLRTFRPATGGAAPRPRVVAMYQPEKPRRCPRLMAAALDVVQRQAPDVEVITVGSSTAPALLRPHTHLGVVSRDELASCYAEGGVGLSISASNPSRVPFEMMASGMPVVEVHAPNTRYDFPSAGCLLAHPDPASLAAALLRALHDVALHRRLSQAAVQFMADRPSSLESVAFVEAFSEALSGRPPQGPDRAVEAYDDADVVRVPVTAPWAAAPTTAGSGLARLRSAAGRRIRR